MSSSAVVVACAICFGAADSPLLDAARLGVLVMVGVTCTMLGAFGLFFIRVARRSRD
jgi:hypothetical protein